jgi:hypothetical protein
MQFPPGFQKTLGDLSDTNQSQQPGNLKMSPFDIKWRVLILHFVSSGGNFMV